MDKLKRYKYIVHPDLQYFMRKYLPYNQDVTGIHENLTKGVLMYGDPDNIGVMYDSLDDGFEVDNERLFGYLAKKYANLKFNHSSRKYSGESVPLYVLKIPYQYLSGSRDEKDEYGLPLPVFDRMDAPVSRNFREENVITYDGVIRVNPQFNYGVYSRDLGGFVRNPAWNPVPEFLGYTFNKYAIRSMLVHGEAEIFLTHLNNLSDREETLKFQRDLENQIFLNHDTQTVINKYAEIYGDDIPVSPRQLEEEEILNRFNRYWDITTGLTPGDHKKDVRFM